MKTHLTKITASILAVIMTTTLITPAFAAETNPGNVPVELTTQAANFSVTLPTVLPVDVNAEGVVTVALDATITNNSAGPITLASAKVTPKNTWSLVSMDTDFAKLPAGTKSIGFSLFNKEVPTSGTADISAVSLINGNSTIGLPYGSKLTTQNEAITEQPLDVLFTVGWYKGGNSVVDSPEALLALDKENLSMMVGAEETITATFVEKETPKGRSAFMLNNVDGVTFTSTNDEVATVDANGLITAVGKGTAKVIATAKGLDATCNITVNALKVPLSAIDVNKTNVVLNKGTTEKLVLMYNPSKFDANATVTWSSSDTNIATVTPLNEEHDGTTGTPSYATITAVNGGNASVTVNVVSGGNSFSKVINVVVNEPMTGLDVPTNLETKVGETVNIIANKLPSNTTDTNTITYESNDTSIATVDSNGVVTGISPGDTSILIKSGYFTKNTSITVTGAAPPVLSNITDYYTYTNDAATGGYKVALSTGFKSALDGNTNFTDTNSNVWIAGSALPNPGNTYNGKPVTNMYMMFYKSKDPSLDLSNFDTSNVTDMSYMFSSSQTATIDLSSFDTSNVTTMSSMFENSEATKILGLNTFNTSKVTTMSYMFNGSKATTLDLSSFDTSNVITMSNMFFNSQANSLDLSSFNTSKVTNMSNMFSNSQATTLDLSSFDTSNVTNMLTMFRGVQATTLDLSSFNTSNVTNMGSMFSDCKVTNLDLSNFNTSKVTNMSGMFQGSKQTSLDLSSFDISKTPNMDNMFASSTTTIGYAKNQVDANKFNNTKNKPSWLIFGADIYKNGNYMYIYMPSLNGYVVKIIDNTQTTYAPPLETVDNKPVISYEYLFLNYPNDVLELVNNWENTNVNKVTNMFNNSQAISLNLSNFNTSNITDMSYMFYHSKTSEIIGLNTSSVTNMYMMFKDSIASSLDLTSFNTSKVTNMSNMFNNSQATTLDLSSFDTSNVTNMSNMFSGSQATTLNLSNFNTSSVTNMNSMFNNSQATTLDLSSFNTSKVTDVEYMFSLSQATILNLSSFDTSSITSMYSMFHSSKATNIIGLDKFDTSNVTTMYGMFNGSQVITLDLSSFDTSKVTNMYSMLQNAITTTGYARTQADADNLNNSSSKPFALTFVVK